MSNPNLPLIIDKPRLRPMPNRIGWSALAFILGLLWIYLWLPLMTVALWALGYHQFTTYLPWSGKNHELRHLFILYFAIIAALGGSLVSWASLEYWRFRNANRRTAPTPVAVDELAVYAELRSCDMHAWQNARCLVVTHDDHGRMIDADIRC